jgi:hypothetical protein
MMATSACRQKTQNDARAGCERTQAGARLNEKAVTGLPERTLAPYFKQKRLKVDIVLKFECACKLVEFEFDISNSVL